MFYQLTCRYCGQRILFLFYLLSHDCRFTILHREQNPPIIHRFYGQQCSPLEIQIQPNEILLHVSTEEGKHRHAPPLVFNVTFDRKLCHL